MYNKLDLIVKFARHCIKTKFAFKRIVLSWLLHKIVAMSVKSSNTSVLLRLP